MSSYIYVSNFTRSGLCDKLIDIFLLSTYCNINNTKLLIAIEDWNIFASANAPNIVDHRKYDYKYENISKYFSFPNNIIFINKNTLNNYRINIFSDYLGGCISLESFYNTYINSSIIPFDVFINKYKETAKEFNYKDKINEIIPLNLVHNEKYVAIHIRRSDKISYNPDDGQLLYNKLDELNNNTYAAIKKLYNNGYNNFYIASDDHNVKLEYVNIIKSIDNKINVSYYSDNNYNSTYIDLYMLKNADYIVMSIRHSNFSLVPSLSSNVSIIYFYEDSFIDLLGYKNIFKNNFLYHKQLYNNE